MKTYYLLFVLIFLLSCTERKQRTTAKEEIIGTESKWIETDFESILDSAEVKGTILIYDPQKDRYYSNDFEWARIGRLPASTFKIANSIIALETGVVKNDSSLFKWDGRKRFMKTWERDMVLKEAFHLSCVPCYQEVARKIGAKQMNKYLDAFNYGEMQVDSNNIDRFWLEGKSRISPFQQIDFLRKFYRSELPISKRTEDIMNDMIVSEQTEEYTLSSKTGWSIRNGNNNGWFVGYIETRKGIWFFATNVEPEEAFDMKMFPMIRKDITFKALRQVEIMK